MAVTKKAAFIDDGYTLEHCFLPDDFRDEEVCIKFRPATSMERVRMNTEVAKLAQKEKMEEIDALSYRFVASHLIDLIVDGQVKSISPEIVGDMEPHLLAEMYQVVFGSKPSVSKERESDQKN